MKESQDKPNFKSMPGTFGSKQRYCQGACKKRRSIMQFNGADELCKTCRARTPITNNKE